MMIRIIIVWRLQYVDTVMKGTELYCYNTEGDRNSVLSQGSGKMFVTKLE